VVGFSRSGWSDSAELGGRIRRTPQTVTSGGTGTVDGQSVVILKAADGTTVDIAGSGTAYPVQVRTDTAVYHLSDWNGVGTFTPPPNPIVIPSTS
jgi:hypothetical protein